MKKQPETVANEGLTVYVREVRVNYQSTEINAFKIEGPDDIVNFVRTVLTDNTREHAVALYMDASH